MSAPVYEKGYMLPTAGQWWQGLNAGQWWQELSEEEIPELRWPLSVSVYEQMRRDPQVRSVMQAVTSPIQRTNWWVDPNGARDQVVEQVSDDLGLPIQGQAVKPLPRTRDRFSWNQHLFEALLCLTFGFAYFEQQARIDDGGRARLQKLAYRPPRTLEKVEVAADGGLVGIRQRSVKSLIGVNRIVGYVNEREGANWYGTSLLRAAYGPWLLKQRAMRVEAITGERNGLGIATYTGPDFSYEADAEARRILETDDQEAGLALASASRASDGGGAALTHGAQLEFKGVSGSLPNHDLVIRRHDEQIGRAVLANFLSLGGDNSTGSYALGDTFEGFFTLSLQTRAMQIASTVSQHVVEDIVDWNWGEAEPAPRIVFDEIGSRYPATADAIQKLVMVGAITPDADLERHERVTYGLPAHDPKTARPYTAAEPPTTGEAA